MKWSTLLAAICFVVAMCGLFTANASYYTMIEEIDKQRPIDRKIPVWSFNARWQTFNNIREYRRLFPSSKLLTYYRFGMAAMTAGLISVFLCLISR